MNSSNPALPSSTPGTGSKSPKKNSPSSNPYSPNPGTTWVGVQETGFLERVQILGTFNHPEIPHEFILFEYLEPGYSYRPMALHIETFLAAYSPIESLSCETTPSENSSSRISSLRRLFSFTSLAGKWQNLRSRARFFW